MVSKRARGREMTGMDKKEKKERVKGEYLRLNFLDKIK